MHGVLAAETAVLVELETFRGVLFVLHGVVVPLLAFVAPKGDPNASSVLRHVCGTSF
jgi:hypothetical protein